MEETKYGQYIKREPIRDEEPAPRRKTYPHIHVDAELLSGYDVNCNFALSCVSEPYMMPDQPHSHPFDEFLLFIGSDPKNLRKLGGVVEIGLGDEWEKHTINTTSVVYLPNGLPHAPVNVKKVDKPFLFGHIMLSPSYAKK